MRKPSMPRSNQVGSTSSNIATTSGLSQLKSGWRRIEAVQVPLPGRAVRVGSRVQAGPPKTDRQLFGGSAAVRPRPSRKRKRARSGDPGGAASACLEPRVLVGAVVGHEVHQHLEAAGMRGVEQPVEGRQAAVQRVDVEVVGDVVAAVAVGRRVAGVEPEPVDAERGDVVEPSGDAVEVADAVAVASRRRTAGRAGRRRWCATRRAAARRGWARRESSLVVVTRPRLRRSPTGSTRTTCQTVRGGSCAVAKSPSASTGTSTSVPPAVRVGDPDPRQTRARTPEAERARARVAGRGRGRRPRGCRPGRSG